MLCGALISTIYSPAEIRSRRRQMIFLRAGDRHLLLAMTVVQMGFAQIGLISLECRIWYMETSDQTRSTWGVYKELSLIEIALELSYLLPLHLDGNQSTSTSRTVSSHYKQRKSYLVFRRTCSGSPRCLTGSHISREVSDLPPCTRSLLTHQLNHAFTALCHQLMQNSSCRPTFILLASNSYVALAVYCM